MIATDVKNEQPQALDRLTNAVAEHREFADQLGIQGQPLPVQVEQNEKLLTAIVHAAEEYRTAFRRAVQTA